MADSTDARLSRLEADLKEIAAAAANDGEVQRRLHGILQSSVAQVETPADFLWQRYLYIHQAAVIRTAIELKLPHIIAQEERDYTAAELAKAVGAEELLIVRIMRALTALNVFTETGKTTYRSAPISKAIATTPALEGGYRFMYDLPGLSVAHMCKALNQHGYANPNTTVMFYSAFNTEKPVFAWLGEQTRLREDFNSLMVGSRYNRSEWHDFFPAKTELIDGFDSAKSDVFMVDVGGAEGYELKLFHQKFPEVKGRLILQDRQDVIDMVKSHLDPAVEAMGIDFFVDQPIKGARVYYLRNIFHDWPKSAGHVILKHIVASMTPGYSILLINEWILPDTNCPLYPALLDINMMACLAGIERTESDWREFLEGWEGVDGKKIKIVKFHQIPMNEGVIQCVLV